MKRILSFLLIFSLITPTCLLPYQASKQGVTLEAQDITHIPLGNLFKPEAGDRQDMASIDVNKKLNLCLVGISIKNESAVNYVLDPKIMSPYVHQDYKKLMQYLTDQDHVLYWLNAKSMTTSVLGISFAALYALMQWGFGYGLRVSPQVPKMYGSAAALLLPVAFFYALKAQDRAATLTKDRNAWIKLFGLDNELLVIAPGQTVKKVILLDRGAYAAKDFMLLLEQGDSWHNTVSFSIPLNAQADNQQGGK